jgi:hypothetical protein
MKMCWKKCRTGGWWQRGEGSALIRAGSTRSNDALMPEEPQPSLLSQALNCLNGCWESLTGWCGTGSDMSGRKVSLTEIKGRFTTLSESMRDTVASNPTICFMVYIRRIFNHFECIRSRGLVDYQGFIHLLVQLVLRATEVVAFTYAGEKFKDESSLLIRGAEVGALFATLFALLVQIVSLYIQHALINDFGKRHFIQWLIATLKKIFLSGLLPLQFFTVSGNLSPQDTDAERVIYAFVISLCVTAAVRLEGSLLTYPEPWKPSADVGSVSYPLMDDRRYKFEEEIKRVANFYKHFEFYWLFSVLMLLSMNDSWDRFKNQVSTWHISDNPYAQNITFSSVSALFAFLLANAERGFKALRNRMIGRIEGWYNGNNDYQGLLAYDNNTAS